ncbi:unnamed protein product [Rodentolepis nana]|uniref:Uncharacterized protein n=1 Tax=Rodentolepis nana TaxID=102285 RepID=A0A0R3T6E2_RODNA|nr:unnamed protein product [Rodentolepis nana]
MQCGRVHRMGLGLIQVLSFKTGMKGIVDFLCFYTAYSWAAFKGLSVRFCDI